MKALLLAVTVAFVLAGSAFAGKPQAPSLELSPNTISPLGEFAASGCGYPTKGGMVRLVIVSPTGVHYSTSYWNSEVDANGCISIPSVVPFDPLEPGVHEVQIRQPKVSAQPHTQRTVASAPLTVTP